MQIISFCAVTIPFIGVLAAGVLLWGTGFNWIYLAIMGLMYFITAMGITVGYHRLFTHKSFATFRPIAYAFGAMGAMAAQGPVIHWVAEHRRHHQHSDEEDDPHSPHGCGDSFLGLVRGAWHAHMGWLFRRSSPTLNRYVKDLRSEWSATRSSSHFLFWVLAGLAIPAILGGLLTMSWLGALLGLIWGGLVRIFLVHHVTWSVNSICHLWGTRPFKSHDESRNNVIVGVLAMGEGWHNNHHAFPTSARHGLRFWEIDVSYMVIRAMNLVGLAWDIRTPSPERMAAAKAG